MTELECWPADTLQRPGQHVELQAQLFSICHMAVCDATSRLASPADASFSREADGIIDEDSEEDDDADRGSAAAADALLTALTSLSRVVVIRLTRVCWGGRVSGHAGGVDADVDIESQSAELEAIVDVLGLLLHVMQQASPSLPHVRLA